MSLRASSLARMASYSQHSSDTTYHTSVIKSRTEASIHVSRMFNHMHSNNMINRGNVSIKQSNIPYIMIQGSEKDYRAESSGIRLSIAQLLKA
jgi:hypothetical protein